MAKELVLTDGKKVKIKQGKGIDLLHAQMKAFACVCRFPKAAAIRFLCLIGFLLFPTDYIQATHLCLLKRSRQVQEEAQCRGIRFPIPNGILLVVSRQLKWQGFLALYCFLCGVSLLLHQF